MQSNTSGILRQPWVLLLGAAVVAFILFQLTVTSRLDGAFFLLDRFLLFTCAICHFCLLKELQ